MGEARDWAVEVREVEDAVDDRVERVTELLAIGIDRWLKGRPLVDAGADVSVYPDVNRNGPA